MMLYNIAPSSAPAQLYTPTDIHRAAAAGRPLLLNVEDGKPPIPCHMAALVNGWCTVALNSGAIVQDWAGCFQFA